MAFIKAISCYTPSSVLTNDKLQEELSSCEVAKTAKGVGVESRHIASEDMTAGDKVLIAGFGVGLSWASTVLTFK